MCYDNSDIPTNKPLNLFQLKSAKRMTPLWLISLIACICSAESAAPQLQRVKLEIHSPKLATKFSCTLRSLLKEAEASDLVSSCVDRYVGRVFLGTPPQVMNVEYDTSSSVLWVVETVSKRWSNQYKSYNHNLSSTYKADRTPFEGTHGDRTVSGYYSMDTVAIANISLERALFAEVNKIIAKPLGPRKSFEDGGICGLGVATMPGTRDFGPLSMLMHSTDLEEKSFAFYFGQSYGELVLGGADTERYQGDMNFSAAILPPEVPSGLWAVRLQGLSIDALGIHTNADKAIFDTTTPFIGVPPGELTTLARLVGAKPMPLPGIHKKVHAIDCHTPDMRPNITFVIGNVSYNLTGSDYVTKIGFESFAYCLFGFMEVDSPYFRHQRPAFILGRMFLKRHYSKFEVDEKRVGLARVREVQNLEPTYI